MENSSGWNFFRQSTEETATKYGESQVFSQTISSNNSLLTVTNGLYRIIISAIIAIWAMHGEKWSLKTIDFARKKGGFCATKLFSVFRVVFQGRKSFLGFMKHFQTIKAFLTLFFEIIFFSSCSFLSFWGISCRHISFYAVQRTCLLFHRHLKTSQSFFVFFFYSVVRSFSSVPTTSIQLEMLLMISIFFKLSFSNRLKNCRINKKREAKRLN